MAGQEAGNTTGTDNRLGVWALTNTKALDGPGTPTLISTTITSEPYVVPPPSTQKLGSVPLAECLNLPACTTKYFGAQKPYHEREGQLDSSDTRIFQTTYANGLLWGACTQPEHGPFATSLENSVSLGLGSFRSERNGIAELLQPPDMVSLDATRIELVEVVVT